MFYAVATLVNPSENSELQATWKWIFKVCQAQDVQPTRMPHLSWHVSMDYDAAALDDFLKHILPSLEPFDIRTTGVGIFSGEHPVVYLPVVKTRKIVELHELLFKGINHLTGSPNRFYNPDVWIPHITVVYESSLMENICGVINELARKPIETTLRFDHLAVIYRDGDVLGQQERYDLNQVENFKPGQEASKKK
jgi:2'-5' RNA ligase